MDATSVIGPVVRADGAYRQPLAGSRNGGLLASRNGAGRYYEMTSRGWVYHVMVQTLIGVQYPITSSAAVLTPPEYLVPDAATLLSLLNPIGSGVNLEILTGFWGLGSSSVELQGFWAWFGAMTYGTITAAENATRKGACLIGQGVTKAKSWSLTALTGAPAQYVFRPFPESFVVTGGGAGSKSIVAVDNVDGGIVVPPGGLLTLGMPFFDVLSNTCTAGIVYAEVPLPG